MAAVPEDRLNVLRQLFRSLPYSALRSLEMALGLTDEVKMVEVRALITAEMEFRHIRDRVFEPFLPLFYPREDGLSGQVFNPHLLDSLWQALATHQPDLLNEARICLRALTADDTTPVIFFSLSEAAADMCRTAHPALLTPNSDADRSAQLTELAHYLDLHRLSVQILRRLGDFMGRINAEKAAALRLLFQDASAIDAASGTRFLEIVYANLDDGAQIIKFVAMVSDRPNDRFLGESELATFGTRILDHMENKLSRLTRLTTGRICDYAEDISELVLQSLNQLQAFGQYIELARDGPWGLRVTKARKLIAERVEHLLNKAEKTLNDALPTYSDHVVGRLKMERLDIAQPASEDVAARALRLCRFIHNMRHIAPSGGFATLHTKVTQALEARLDAAFSELLDMTSHAGEISALRVDAQHLGAAFERVLAMMEALCEPNKAHTARRRMASAQIAQAATG
ncbi:MAG: hypothetical protein WBQ60_06880 [Asticcacaulis sp.]